MFSVASRSITALAALVLAASVFAQSPQVYRYVDATGRVVYSDRPPPADAKTVQTKRLGANYVETSEPDVAAQTASERFPAVLFTFECGEICTNAESLLNKRGVPFTVIDVQRDEQGMLRMKALTGEERAPVLALGDKIVVKGFSDARWQAALDEAGYPKAQGAKRGVVGGRTADVPPPPQGSVEGARAVTPAVRGGDYPKN
jgi:glutaredoxin